MTYGYVDILFSTTCGVAVLVGYGMIVMWRFGHKSNWRADSIACKERSARESLAPLFNNTMVSGLVDPRYKAGNRLLLDLSDDIATEIMSYLNVFELIVLRNVCKQLHDAVMEEHVWYMMQRQLLFYNIPLVSEISDVAVGNTVTVRVSKQVCGICCSDCCFEKEGFGCELAIVRLFQCAMERQLMMIDSQCTHAINKLLYCIYIYPTVYMEVAKRYCAENRINFNFVVIQGSVFQIPAEFLSSHPGGTSILEDALGTDASAAYHLAYHSPVAIDLAKSFCVWDHAVWLGTNVNKRLWSTVGGSANATTSHGAGGYARLHQYYEETGNINIVQPTRSRSRSPACYPVIFSGDGEFPIASIINTNDASRTPSHDLFSKSVDTDSGDTTLLSPSTTVTNQTRTTSLYDWVCTNYNSLYPVGRKVKYETHTRTALEQSAPLSNQLCQSLCSLRDAFSQ